MLTLGSHMAIFIENEKVYAGKYKFSIAYEVERRAGSGSAATFI